MILEIDGPDIYGRVEIPDNAEHIKVYAGHTAWLVYEIKDNTSKLIAESDPDD